MISYSSTGLASDGNIAYVLNFTIIPPPNAVASYYEMNFKGGFYATRCYVSAYKPPFVCTYRNLQPDTTYEFEYYGGRLAWGLDIYSDIKYKTVSTPPIRKCYIFLTLMVQTIISA